MILGTYEGQGNIRFGNSRAKFLCVVKMLIYINKERRKRDAAGTQKRGQAGKLAVYAVVERAAAAARSLHEEIGCASGTGS